MTYNLRALDGRSPGRTSPRFRCAGCRRLIGWHSAGTSAAAGQGRSHRSVENRKTIVTRDPEPGFAGSCQQGHATSRVPARCMCGSDPRRRRESGLYGASRDCASPTSGRNVCRVPAACAKTNAFSIVLSLASADATCVQERCAVLAGVNPAQQLRAWLALRSEERPWQQRAIPVRNSVSPGSPRMMKWVARSIAVHYVMAAGEPEECR